jgi:hypothetical protein
MKHTAVPIVEAPETGTGEENVAEGLLHCCSWTEDQYGGDDALSRAQMMRTSSANPQRTSSETCSMSTVAACFGAIL